MTINEPGLTALRIGYAAVRMPLDLLNEQLVARAFGPDSPAHRSLTQGLQTLDGLAAKALASCSAGPTDVEDDRDDDTQDLGAADVIEVPTVADEPEPATERADETIDRDEQQEISDLADRYLADDQLGNRAGELADDDEVRRVQAEIRAKQAIEDQHGQF